MIGGFLGAGKTTLIGRLATHYTQQGLRVGLVTNDQAYDLVDTQSLRAQGFRVGEVPGACFCCKFDDLVDTAAQLADEQIPDIIMTEPVGSCTDLVSTVIEPLQHLHGDAYEIAPLAVLLKPEHGQKILRDSTAGGFSPKAAYIFLKQIEEAEIVAINKIDKLTDSDRAELIRLVETQYPGKTVLALSGREGLGLPQFLEALDSPRSSSRQVMEVDYDVYAEGEAELGWLNCQAVLDAEHPGQTFSLDQALLELLAELRASFTREAIEVAHLKVMGQSGQNNAVANLVSTSGDVELSFASEIDTQQAELTVNARAATAPEQLEACVLSALEQLAQRQSLRYRVQGMQRFRPGRPTPTHRYA